MKAKYERHGHHGTRIYFIWKDMRKRCNNPNCSCYHNYGGRGIKVCERWDRFQNFYDDMFPTYQDGLTLERKDVNGDYEPSNCCWIPRKEQFNNMRKSYADVNIAELSKKTGISKMTLYKRLYAGWPIDKLTLPSSCHNTWNRVKNGTKYRKVG